MAGPDPDRVSASFTITSKRFKFRRMNPSQMITSRPSLISNPPLSWKVRVFRSRVLIVLLGGIVLLVAPEAIMPRWPWRLGQYSARFLGAIYSAEFVALGIFEVINRVAPGQLMACSCRRLGACLYPAAKAWEIT